MILSLFRILLLCLLPAPAGAAESSKPHIQSVVSPGGIAAWLWQDDSVPVISIRALVRGGFRLDPKPGMGHLLRSLSGLAAGTYDPIAFERRFAALSAYLSLETSAAFDHIFIRMSRAKLKPSAELIALALTRPVVPPNELERARATLKQGELAKLKDPFVRAMRLEDLLLLGDRAPMVTADPRLGVDQITLEDLMQVHQSRITRANLSVAVAGAIRPDELAPLLDQLFGALPAGEPAPPLPVFPDKPAPGFYHIPLPGAPQSALITLHPGIDPTDADFWPVVILNQVLGGDTFLSRLGRELRETRGLVYSVGGGRLFYGELLPIWSTVAALAPNQVAEALAITKRLWAALQARGISQSEFEMARDYCLGILVTSLTSTEAMADSLNHLQRSGLPATYYDDSRAILAGLTLEKVNGVAKSFIDPAGLVTIVAGETTPDLPPSLPLPSGF